VKIALVSEGTYPYALGGVSLWCDQLIRGMPDYRWEMVALTVDGTEREVWKRPDNLEAVRSIPMWSAAPFGRRRRDRPGAAFTSAYQSFLTALLNPLDPRSDQAAVNRSRFLLALRGLYEYSASGGRLTDALTSNEALTQLMDAWHDTYDGGLHLADAIEGAWLIERMLRPLTAPPVVADVVHAAMNGLSMLVAMASKWRHGTPIVMSEHGIYLRERYLAALHEDTPHAVKVLLLSFFRALAGGGYLIADAVTPHSSYNRRWQIQHGADPERMWTMYNGVAPDDFPAAGSEPEQPTIVFMGRIDPLKDLHTLIRAFAVVRDRVPNARLRIFGGTPAGNELYHRSCQQLIDELGLRDSAALEGKVSSQVDAYHAATIVALTSISEGFPYSVIEAMSCGRAVVCTNVGGVAEAVADAGIVVSPRDHVAIADGCVALLTDHERRARMAATARSRVLDLFTLRQSVEAYRQVYQQLTGRSGRLEIPETKQPDVRRVAEPRPPARGRVVVPSQRRSRPAQWSAPSAPAPTLRAGSTYASHTAAGRTDPPRAGAGAVWTEQSQEGRVVRGRGKTAT
jgi:glycosyltransferase involved in cell wall biosynthesis